MRVTGDTVLASELRAASAKAAASAAAATRAAAAGIERDAKLAAPVDTGNLRSSITTSIAMNGLRAEVGPTAEYAEWVETGTSRMAAQPFLFPAVDRHAASWYAAMAKVGDL